jgi:hypothetical protein
MTYERVQKATSVQVGVPYQIDGRIDTIVLGSDGRTSHYKANGELVTQNGRNGSALTLALQGGTLWECREVA